MKRIIIGIYFLIFGNFALAQTAVNEFDNANKFYHDNNYAEALTLYESLVSKNYISAELYYNLANTYYKLDRLAPAILYYKKCLKLDPNSEDAIFNLTMAEAKTIDKFDVLPKTNIVLIWDAFNQLLSVKQWAILSIISSFICAIGFLLFKFAQNSSHKRLSFVFSISFLFVMIVSYSLSLKNYNYQQSHREAVVMVENTYVKVAPNSSSEDAFILHEGSVVMVTEELDSWARIKLSDGKVGWIKFEDLGLV